MTLNLNDKTWDQVGGFVVLSHDENALIQNCMSLATINNVDSNSVERIEGFIGNNYAGEVMDSYSLTQMNNFNDDGNNDVGTFYGNDETNTIDNSNNYFYIKDLINSKIDINFSHASFEMITIKNFYTNTLGFDEIIWDMGNQDYLIYYPQLSNLSNQSEILIY